MQIQDQNLKNGITRVLDRLRFFPDEEFLRKFPYGTELVERSKEFGGIEEVLNNLGRDTYFQAATVEIPSPEQQLAATEIALAGEEGRKRFEFSKPGTRKTIGVLSAIPVINEILTKEQGEKVKTLICCPTYIIPTWIREAERLLKDPNITVVTRRNRQHSIKKAAKEDVDIVLLGYELSYRRTGIDTNDSEVIAEMEDRYVELLTNVYTKDRALEILEKSMNKNQFENYSKKDRRLDSLLRKIVLEEKNSEVASIATALRKHAFKENSKPYYTIYDEIHNVIDPESATALALADLFRSSKWGALVSGTGIRNKISNIAYEFYLMGIIEDPKDFTTLFRDKPKMIRAALDNYANTTRELKDVDPKVMDPININLSYTLNEKEMEIYIGLINSTLFEGREKYLLLNYLLTNPRKILPENFTDNEKGDSLKSKVESFFAANPKLREYAETVNSSKLEVSKNIVDNYVRDRKKLIVACEYSTNLTTFLEDKLNKHFTERELEGYSCIRIDQTVSAQPVEIPLTKEEIRILKEGKLHEKGEKFRSDLSLKARKLLGIKNYQIWSPSPRELALLEFQTNPRKPLMVVSYGTLREGADVQEASGLIEYECTTVPSKFEQLKARILRSGKHDQVEVYQPVAENTFEGNKYKFRDWKAYLIDLVYKGEDATTEEIEAFIADTKPEKSAEIGNMLNLNSRGIVALMFASLTGKGVDRFIEEMSSHDNALFLAKNYNYEWEYSYSANCSRLTREIVIGLENKIGRKLEDIVDEGCGPATISRILDRKTICIDVNRFQLDYGITACKEKKIKANKYYVGSYTNLKNLVPHSEDNKIFDTRKKYEKTESLEDRSQDLAVCSLALDFATEEERKQYFTTNKNVLRKNGYMIIIEPPSKIDENCREQLFRDINEIGFEVDRELTGTYKSQRVIDVDTGEQKRNGFEAYVIVAKKINESTPEYQEGRNYFRMMNEYKITEENTDAERNIMKKEAKLRRYECGNFFNIDTNIEPTKLRPEVGEPIHPDAEALARTIEAAPEEELSRLANALRRLAED